MSRPPLRLRIDAPAAPEPALLRRAIATRLAGRAFPSRAEDAVAARVAVAVRERLADQGPGMALIKGILASLDDPLLGVVPTIVPLQYNRTEVTRVFSTEGDGGTDTGGGSTGSALNAARPAPEDYRSSSSWTQPTASRRAGR
jgi:hypothetical protein